MIVLSSAGMVAAHCLVAQALLRQHLGTFEQLPFLRVASVRSFKPVSFVRNDPDGSLKKNNRDI